MHGRADQLGVVLGRAPVGHHERVLQPDSGVQPGASSSASASAGRSSRGGRVLPKLVELVGELDLHSDKFLVPGTDAVTLVVFHAEAGSRSADSLELLGSLAASSG